MAAAACTWCPGRRSSRSSIAPALEVGWDVSARSLHSPTPREGDYVGWYRRLVTAAAQEYGCRLRLTERTVWIDVERGIRAQLIEASASLPGRS